MLDLNTPLEWLLAGATVFVGSAIQGTLGLGLAIFSVPVLALIDPAFVPVPLQLIAPAIAGASLLRERAALDVKGAGWVLAGRLPGALIGAWVLAVFSTRDLSIVMSLFVLGTVVALLAGLHIPITRTSKVGSGVLSGAMGTSTGIGGPPLALLYAGQQGPEIRATLGAVFTFGLLINLVVLGLAGHITADAIQRAAGLAIPLGLGFAVSSRIKHRFNARRLRVGMLIAAAFSSIVLLVRALS